MARGDEIVVDIAQRKLLVLVRRRADVTADTGLGEIRGTANRRHPVFVLFLRREASPRRLRVSAEPTTCGAVTRFTADAESRFLTGQFRGSLESQRRPMASEALLAFVRLLRALQVPHDSLGTFFVQHLKRACVRVVRQPGSIFVLPDLLSPPRFQSAVTRPAGAGCGASVC